MAPTHLRGGTTAAVNQEGVSSLQVWATRRLTGLEEPSSFSSGKKDFTEQNHSIHGVGIFLNNRITEAVGLTYFLIRGGISGYFYYFKFLIYHALQKVHNTINNVLI